jgi:GT2 family glycosyltransferase
MGEKIGVGIITCNRPHYLKSLLDSIKPCADQINELVIVNDGKPVNVELFKGEWILNEKNLGVGKSKNKAMTHLLNKGCEYIFIIEDDMVVLNKNVFQKYIEAYKVSGIHHFNYDGLRSFSENRD